MDAPKIDISNRIGSLVGISTGKGKCKAYIPKGLPLDPPLDTTELNELIDRATADLGQLNAIRRILPSSDILLSLYGRKEALVSSQIEGTQSTMSDVLGAEAVGEGEKGEEEVSRYLDALKQGITKMEKLPVSLRLVKQLHKTLMEGDPKDTPGEFRQFQNWIGDEGDAPQQASLVPPPPEKIIEHLDNLEKFIHHDSSPILVRAAIAHAQFETIHPFLDGNGRVGRLLIILMLCASGIIKEPILYLSLYFKKNRTRYYSHLRATHQNGDWESWVKFFLQGVIETADDSFTLATNIADLFQRDEKSITEKSNSANMLTVHKVLQKSPIITPKTVMRECQISHPAAMKILKILQNDIGLIKELGERYNHKMFVYSQYFEFLKKDTDPLPP